MVTLLDHCSDKCTNTGNDGIIEYIFKTLNIKKGFFVEFGVWEGLHGYNCRKLCDEGWTGAFIEAKWCRYLRLVWNYFGNKKS